MGKAVYWLNTLLIISVLAVILQLVAYATPGWYIVEYTGDTTNASLHKGLHYQRECDSSGNCRTASIATSCSSNMETSTCISTRYEMATDTMQCAIPLILCAVVMAIHAWAVKGRVWYEAHTSICLILLSWANALQWVLTTRKAAYTHAQSQDISTKVPYSVIMFGIAALFTTIMFAFYLFMFIQISLLSSLAMRENIIKFKMVNDPKTEAPPRVSDTNYYLRKF